MPEGLFTAEWGIAANTLLLIILALVQRQQTNRAQAVKDKLEATDLNVGKKLGVIESDVKQTKQVAHEVKEVVNGTSTNEHRTIPRDYQD